MADLSQVFFTKKEIETNQRLIGDIFAVGVDG